MIHLVTFVEHSCYQNWRVWEIDIVDFTKFYQSNGALMLSSDIYTTGGVLFSKIFQRIQILNSNATGPKMCKNDRNWYFIEYQKTQSIFEMFQHSITFLILFIETRISIH